MIAGQIELDAQRAWRSRPRILERGLELAGVEPHAVSLAAIDRHLLERDRLHALFADGALPDVAGARLPYEQLGLGASVKIPDHLGQHLFAHPYAAARRAAADRSGRHERGVASGASGHAVAVHGARIVVFFAP